MARRSPMNAAQKVAELRSLLQSEERDLGNRPGIARALGFEDAPASRIVDEEYARGVPGRACLACNSAWPASEPDDEPWHHRHGCPVEKEDAHRRAFPDGCETFGCKLCLAIANRGAA